jgi:hypothetical protein
MFRLDPDLDQVQIRPKGPEPKVAGSVQKCRGSGENFYVLILGNTTKKVAEHSAVFQFSVLSILFYASNRGSI